MSKEESIFTGERFVPGIDDDEITIEHYQRYESIKELVRGKIVVDAACGEGYGTSIIGSVAKSVTGLDISPDAVSRATEAYATDTVKFQVGDISNLPLEDESTEVFVSFETIEHVGKELQEKFIKEVSRVLKKDGLFIISSPNKEIYSDLFNYDNEFHVHEMYKQEFLDLLSGGFKHVKLFDQYLEVGCFIDSNDNKTDVGLYKKNKERYTSDGKYFIAVASNQPVEEIEIQSVFLKHSVTYRKNIARIIELQNDVEERNAHIKNLDKEIEVLRRQTSESSELRNVIELLHKDGRDKQAYINHIEGICEAYRVELDKIRYYKKHPLRRAYRIARRIGGKVYRKMKPILRKVLPDFLYYQKLTVPYTETPQVSIVIPVYNEFDYTYKCIRSIIENVRNVSYEIIIGDDESKDATKNIIKIIKNIKVNVNHSDHGFLMNCNRAAQLAAGKYIVFLNNDTLVKEDWLESLVSLIESDETIGMVGSKLVYPDGRLQEAGGIIWKDATGWNYGRGQNPEMPEYNYVRECDYISGASIMISKTLWEEIGGFDERFKPAYCEDSDLAFEVRKRGYKVCYQPKSVVVHFEGVSNGTDLNAGLKKYQVENNIKFKEKWKNELEGHYESGEKPFCARERNYGKKVVLFVDHYVPTYDKDAGSKTTFQYIKMFLSKGYVVKFIGDNYAQMEPYTTTLQQMGVEVLYGPWYMEHIFEWIEENKESISFVYLNRPHISIKYIDFFKNRTDIKVIYYGHDLHFLRTKREAELTGNGDLLRESQHWKSTELGLMRKAAVSYYPSVIEENAIHELDESIKVKAITAYVFDKFIENYQYNGNDRKGILFVGGFSHGPNVDAVKWFVDEIYSKVREQKDIPFIIVGSNAPEEIRALDGDGIIFKGFVSDEELAELYRTSRMVVVPLRYGAGVKGKVVEAIYHGAPIITTSVGAEGIVGVENVLSVKDDPAEFAEEILKLYDDMDKLADIGNKTQQFIKENFSIEAVWKIIEEDFQ